MRIDEVKDIYADFSKTYETDVKKIMSYTAYRRVPELILNHLSTARPGILDLGCGTGLSSSLFFKRGYEVTGIDASRSMLKQAGRLPYRKLICQDLEEELRVPDGSFDAVVMVGVMEYLNDPSVILKQAVKKLKRGGVFGLTVPQKSSWYSESGLHSYYKKEIEPVMLKAGLRIVACERILGVEEEGRRAYYRNYVLQKD